MISLSLIRYLQYHLWVDMKIDDNWERNEETGAILFTNKELFTLKQRMGKLEKVVQEQSIIIKELFAIINK